MSASEALHRLPCRQCEGCQPTGCSALPGRTRSCRMLRRSLRRLAPIFDWGEMAFYRRVTTSSRSRRSRRSSSRSTGIGQGCMNSVTGPVMSHVSTAISRDVGGEATHAKNWSRSSVLLPVASWAWHHCSPCGLLGAGWSARRRQPRDLQAASIASKAAGFIMPPLAPGEGEGLKPPEGC